MHVFVDGEHQYYGASRTRFLLASQGDRVMNCVGDMNSIVDTVFIIYST